MTSYSIKANDNFHGMTKGKIYPVLSLEETYSGNYKVYVINDFGQRDFWWASKTKSEVGFTLIENSDSTIQVGDKVKYIGKDSDLLYINTKEIYTVKSIEEVSGIDFLTLKEILESHSYGPERFVKVEDNETEKTNSMSVPERLKEARQALKAIRAERDREMNFSHKPGSAVVHYKSGETFHIGFLTHMVMMGEKVAVTREYTKDGVDFSQTAYIPLDKFDKVVFQRKDKQLVITVSERGFLTYNEEVSKTEMFFN